MTSWWRKPTIISASNSIVFLSHHVRASIKLLAPNIGLGSILPIEYCRTYMCFSGYIADVDAVEGHSALKVAKHVAKYRAAT